MARILFPLDGTDDSYDAIDAGLRALAPGPHDVTLLAVRMDGVDGAPPDLVRIWEEDHDDRLLPTDHACLEVLEEGARRCTPHGVEPRLLEREGKVIDEIVSESQDHDVLVMHALGPSRLHDRLHFSQGGRLVRKAGCHVLLVRTDA